MPFLLIFLCLLVPLSGKVYAQNEHAAGLSENVPSPHLGFFDLNAGPDYRTSTGLSNTTPFRNTALGITGRMQSSLSANVRSNAVRRFQVNDLLAGELSIGSLHSEILPQRKKIWLAYRFEVGGMVRYKINQHNSFGIKLILLKFARDQVSPNVSGSALRIMYRINKIVAEAGIESRRERNFGYLMPHAAYQFSGTIKYLINEKRNAGITGEWLGNSRNYLYTGNEITQEMWSVRAFYGIYF